MGGGYSYIPSLFVNSASSSSSPWRRRIPSWRNSSRCSTARSRSQKRCTRKKICMISMPRRIWNLEKMFLEVTSSFYCYYHQVCIILIKIATLWACQKMKDRQLHLFNFEQPNSLVQSPHHLGNP